jgi:hypothetical protein
VCFNGKLPRVVGDWETSFNIEELFVKASLSSIYLNVVAALASSAGGGFCAALVSMLSWKDGHSSFHGCNSVVFVFSLRDFLRLRDSANLILGDTRTLARFPENDFSRSQPNMFAVIGNVKH